MRHEPHDPTQPEIQTIFDDYLALKRQGATPETEAFVEQYPEAYRQALRQKIKEYQEWSTLVGALKEYEIEKIAADMTGEDMTPPLPWSQRLFGGLTATFDSIAAAFQHPILQPVLAILTVGLLGLVVYQYRQVATLKAETTQLVHANAALRKKVEQAVARNEQTVAQHTTLTQTVAQLESENEVIKTQNAVFERKNAQLQQQVAQTLAANKQTQGRLDSVQFAFDLLMRGEVAPTVAMADLRGDETRGALRNTRSLRGTAEPPDPIPVTPVLTAVRPTTITLQWEGIPDAQSYQITVADLSENIIRTSDAGQQTQATIPDGILAPGETYFWQVEATVDGESRLSSIVGFSVLDSQAVRQVETAEQHYPESAVVLAGVYAAHGLFEDALEQIEKLATTNPDNPLLPRIRDNLLHQLGQR